MAFYGDATLRKMIERINELYPELAFTQQPTDTAAQDVEISANVSGYIARLYKKSGTSWTYVRQDMIGQGNTARISLAAITTNAVCKIDISNGSTALVESREFNVIRGAGTQSMNTPAADSITVELDEKNTDVNLNS